MSISSSRVGRRPAISGLLQRMLRTVFDWLQRWISRPSWWGTRKPTLPPHASLRFEGLESRLLLSADLVGAISASAIPDHVLPSDHLNIPVVVRNIGTDPSAITPVVRLYATTNGLIDAQAVALGESSVNNSQIKPGKSATVSVAVDVSNLDVPGNYSLLAVVDATNRVRESNEGNNIAAAAKPLSIVWSFGSVPGHANADSITLTDQNGTRVTFTLSGPGRGEVVRDGNAFDLRLTGTSSASTLKILASGGIGHAVIDDLTVEGSLKELRASAADLTGILSVGGTVRSLELRNLEDHSEISIAGIGVAVKLSAASVAGASIHSASPFESVSIKEWIPGGAGRGVIAAPSIGKLTVDGAFGANLDLSGAASGPTLSQVQIDGRITGGLWNIGGRAGSIEAKSIEAPWQGSFEGSVQKIKTGQNLSGVLAAPSIGTIDVGGSLLGAKLLIGTTLGNNGVLGRSASPDDHFGQGSIGELRVGGTITNSTILVGVDPFDGIYGNGNDIIVGGAASRIQQIVVGGKLLGTTSFIAGAFPLNVKINGQNVRSANVPQFHVLLPDTIAPQVSIALANDTGASAGDRVTRDPTLKASVIDAGSIVSLLFAIDDFSPERQVDIQSFRQADGSLVIDEVLFASMLGGPLADGAHSVQLTARDATGNTSVKSFSFVLDRTAPAIAHIDLAPESDHGIPGDQLTNASTVALNGLAEPKVAFEVVGTGASGITNSDGSFRIDNVALTEGDNLVTVRFTDLAGNQSTSLQTVRLDSILPSLLIALSNDTGASPTDGLTNDPAIAVEIRDSGLVTSWSVEVDGHSYSEQLIFAGTRTAFSLNAAFFDQLAGGVLADGGHALKFTAHDMAGNTTTQEIPFVLDRTPPPGPQFDLAPGSDTGVQGDQRTREGVVVLQGVTAANAVVTLLGTGLNTIAGGDGQFSFSNVVLTEGQNIFFMQALDAAGNASQSAMVLNRDSTGPALTIGLANDTGPSNSDRTTSDPSLAGQFVDSGNVVSLTVSIDGAAAVEHQGVVSTSASFYIDAAVLDGQAGGHLADGSHTYRVTATDAEGNATIADLDFVLARSVQTPLQFDLARESDSGIAGDHHTMASTVTLVGTAEPGSALTLNGVSIAPSGPDGVFRVEGVVLALGANTFTVQATGPTGSNEFTQTIYRDENPADSGLFPDLAVSGIHTQVVSVDEFGWTTLRVSWTTSNEGSAVAIGRHGAWAETVHLSLDDTPWNGDTYLGALKVTTALAPGASEIHSIDVYVAPQFAGTSYRVYVVTDDEAGFYDPVAGTAEYFANEVAEKDAGEYNDLVIQDIDLGIVPDALPTSGPAILLDGTAVGGSIGESGEPATYSFSLDEATRLYFDALSSAEGMTWTLRTTSGDTVGGGRFDASDAFGVGDGNPLLALEAGAYELVITAAPGQSGVYGFRLLDPEQAAFTNLHLDGGPLLRQVLERGDWTDIYRFEASAGEHYVAGGANDWAIDGALYWRMFDPQGNQIWSSTVSPSDESEFDLSGTYTLMIEGRYARTDPAQYNVYVFTPRDRDIALALNQRTEGFLDSAGQVNTYHFALNQETLAFFDGWLESNGPYFQWLLEDQNGVVAGGNTRQDTVDQFGRAQPMHLDAGEYSLRIEGLDNAAGWYDFALFDLLHGPAQQLSYDLPATGELLRGFDSVLYRFDATAGQEITVSLNPQYAGQGSFDPMQWLLVDAGGNVVANGQDGVPVDTLLGDTGSYSLLIQGHQYGWWNGFYSVTVGPTDAQAELSFDLAPESDTGVAGDHRTTLATVALVGVATPGALVALDNVQFPVIADAAGHFRFDSVPLALGSNSFTVRSVDGEGVETPFTRSIFRDEVPSQAGLFPDLVVSGINTQIMNVDEFGGTALRVSWTTSNVGSAVAVGRHGAWGETVHLSRDDTPWNDDDTSLGGMKVTTALAPGESAIHSIDVYIDPRFAGTRYRIYVVTDNEVGFFDPATSTFESFANEVAEATAGEYNDLAIQDIDLGTIPDALPTSGPALSLDGSAIGGTVEAAGDSDVYTFNLVTPTRLYFDSLSADDGIAWMIRTAGGDTVYSRDFAASDAFGMGEANPLLNLAAGDYELVISNASSETGAYGLRLLDPDLAANRNALQLDRGALPRQTLERGDWTDIYQFHANAGEHYVTGGPNDWAIDGALYWRMFDPQGNQVWTSTTAPSAESVFAFDGTYTLMIEGRVDQLDPASYTAYVFTPQNRDIALTTGQRVQGFLDSPGQVNTYHFTLDEATVAFFDGYLESNGPYFSWTLQGPGGVVEGGSTRSDTTDFTGSARLLNLAAGEYSLTVTGFDNAAGWYNFALFDMRHDAGTPLSVGQATIGALVPGFNSTLYRFEAEAGQAVTIDLSTTDQDWISYDPVHWMLVDAAGSVVAQGQANTPAQATLDSGGSYSVLIQAHQYNWFPVQFGISVTPAGETPGVTFDLSPESDTDVPGDRVTSLNFVNLAGVAAPFSQVSLEFTGLPPVLADETGAFAFSNVFLGFGNNRFIVQAIDPLGNTAVTGGSIFLGTLPLS